MIDFNLIRPVGVLPIPISDTMLKMFEPVFICFFFLMLSFGIGFTVNKYAKAILDVCTKMTGSDVVFLGQYRSFSMALSYDGMSNEYRLTLKGTLSHTIILGADVHGNITRMDNALEGFSAKLETVIEELDNTKVQLENARIEMEAPFSKEAELEEKSARLKELNILLNMDEKDRSFNDYTDLLSSD